MISANHSLSVCPGPLFVPCLYYSIPKLWPTYHGRCVRAHDTYNGYRHREYILSTCYMCTLSPVTCMQHYPTARRAVHIYRQTFCHMSQALFAAVQAHRQIYRHMSACFFYPRILTSIATEEKYFQNITCVHCHLSRVCNTTLPPVALPLYRLTGKYIVTCPHAFFALGF